MQFSTAFLGQLAVLLLTTSSTVSAFHVDMIAPSNLERRSARPSRGPVGDPLVPISDFHPVLGKRSVQEAPLDPAHLSPTSEGMLQWGSQQAGNNPITVARANLKAADGSKLLFMGQFSEFVERVDCLPAHLDGDGLSITFKSAEFLATAKKQWGWLTEDKGNTFYIVTDPALCAEGDSVQKGEPAQYIPYKVADVDYPEDGITAEFPTAQKMGLDKAFQEMAWDLTWGQRVPDAHQKRGFPDVGGLVDKAKEEAERKAREAQEALDKAKAEADAKAKEIEDKAKEAAAKAEEEANAAKKFFEDGFKGLTDKFGEEFNEIKDKLDDLGSGNIEAPKVEWPIDIGPHTERKKLLKSDSVELYCTDCFATGKFEVAGKLVMDKLQIKEASFSINPSNILVRVQLNGILNKSPKTSLKFPIAEANITPGLNIPLIFHFGPQVRVDLNLTKEVMADADFDFGWEAALPDAASLGLSLGADPDPKNEEATKNGFQSQGWDKTSLKTLPFTLNTGELNIQMQSAVIFVLAWDYSLFGIQSYEAALHAPVPQWQGNFTTLSNVAEGACQPGGPKSAIKLDQSLTAGLNFYIGEDVAFENESRQKKVFFEKELYQHTFPVPGDCFPIDDDTEENAEAEVNADPEIKKMDEDIDATEKEIAELEKELAMLDQETGEVGTISGGVAGPTGTGIAGNGTVPLETGAVGSGAVGTGTGAMPTNTAPVPVGTAPVEDVKVEYHRV